MSLCPPAATGSDEEDDSDASTKPIRSGKKKNPVSLFQTGGDPPRERKTRKKGGSSAGGPQGHGGPGYGALLMMCWHSLLSTAPKAAESEEDALETQQKNSNKKGKGKKSKKVMGGNARDTHTVGQEPPLE